MCIADSPDGIRTLFSPLIPQNAAPISFTLPGMYIVTMNNPETEEIVRQEKIVVTN